VSKKKKKKQKKKRRIKCYEPIDLWRMGERMGEIRSNSEKKKNLGAKGGGR